MHDASQLDWTRGVSECPQELAAAVAALRSRPRAASPPPVPEAALAAARAAGDRARAAGGGGTAMPGRVLLDMVPDALERLAARLEHGVVLVSGTNGKTTTASMIAAVARRAGHAVVHNRAGANTHWGAATALVEQAGDVAVLEVDEAWLTVVAPQVRPRVMVLLNLFRDRLDAYGERESLVAAWQRVVETAEPDTALVLNADDAFVGALHAGRSAPAVHYGIEDRSLARAERDHAADALHCRVCDGPLSFDAFILSHLGHYRCSRCGASRPAPQVAARTVRAGGLERSAMEVDTPAGSIDVRLRLPGLYNAYNGLAAVATGVALGIDPRLAADALAELPPVFGRGEQVTVGGRELLIVLTKNPAGTNEVLRTLAHEPGQHDLWLALNDGFADGRDVSWIWDVEYERLAGAVRTVTCAGTRAAELALRLRYAGWPAEAIEAREDVAGSLDRALERAPGRLVALPTYTALLELRGLLTDRGLAPPYWA